jgi:glucose/arabinose dehydrogenase
MISTPNGLRIVGFVLVCVIAETGGYANRPNQTRRHTLVPHHISLARGRSFDINLPKDFGISVAAQGLRRVRFMARSPDNRIFVTDMYDLTDNQKGAVYILDEFDSGTNTFKKITTYMKGLRNPNSIAFYTDAQGVSWFYLALTDRLVRYKYTAGEQAPEGRPEVLATFPDYGLSYKYGGWHLTRTIAIGENGKIYVAVGSSCNACEEKEEVRASVLEMNPDGTHQKHFARGLRNAVGLRWVNQGLYATNMGSDHLGDHKPADTMYSLVDGRNYGWPYCYQAGPARLPDPKFNPGGKKLNCRNVPQAYAAFDAHSSPLGFEFFDSHEMGPVPKSGYGGLLRDSFLVALHGSTKKRLNRGYRVVRLPPGRKPGDRPEDFITGFLAGGKVFGRPVDILSFGVDAFLLTDDNAGVVYYVYEK